MQTLKSFGSNHKFEILKKYKSVISELSRSRICYIGYDEDNDIFYICEECDEYFYHTLTKDECKELSNLFKEISEIL